MRGPRVVMRPQFAAATGGPPPPLWRHPFAGPPISSPALVVQRRGRCLGPAPAPSRRSSHPAGASAARPADGTRDRCVGAAVIARPQVRTAAGGRALLRAAGHRPRSASAHELARQVCVPAREVGDAAAGCEDELAGIHSPRSRTSAAAILVVTQAVQLRAEPAHRAGAVATCATSASALVRRLALRVVCSAADGTSDRSPSSSGSSFAPAGAGRSIRLVVGDLEKASRAPRRPHPAPARPRRADAIALWSASCAILRNRA